jgi:hypothetical protein
VADAVRALATFRTSLHVGQVAALPSSLGVAELREANARAKDIVASAKDPSTLRSRPPLDEEGARALGAFLECFGDLRGAQRVYSKNVALRHDAKRLLDIMERETEAERA